MFSPWGPTDLLALDSWWVLVSLAGVEVQHAVITLITSIACRLTSRDSIKQATIWYYAATFYKRHLRTRPILHELVPTTIHSLCLSAGPSIRPFNPSIRAALSFNFVTPSTREYNYVLFEFIRVQMWQFPFPQLLIGNALRCWSLSRERAMCVLDWYLTILTHFIPSYFSFVMLLSHTLCQYQRGSKVLNFLGGSY